MCVQAVLLVQCRVADIIPAFREPAADSMAAALPANMDWASRCLIGALPGPLQ